MENPKNISCSCSKHNTIIKQPAKDEKKMSILNILSAVLLFLFPKCPLCWAAYATVFSFVGLENISYNSNWKYVMLSIFLMGSFFLLRKHYLKKSWISIMLYGLGTSLLLITFYLNLNETWWLYIVLILIVLSNFSIRNSHQLMILFKRPFFVET
jgi:hypothetical protein